MHASGVLDSSLSRTVYGLQQFSFADAFEIYVLEFEAKYLASIGVIVPVWLKQQG
jgi:hypothetical protein